MNLTLHIERLVLDGLPLSPAQGAALQSSLARELKHLLTTRGLENISGGAVPHLSVASIQLSRGSQPGQWGRQIARSLCDGLAPATAPVRNSSPNPPAPVAREPMPHFSSNNPTANAVTSQ
jgi:hypothetical protein